MYGDIRQCDGTDNAWVCGTNASDCTNSFRLPNGFADDNRNVKLEAIVSLPSVYTSTVTVSGSGSVVTGTATATAAASASMLPFQNSESKSGTTIGLGAGLGVGVPLLAALCVSLFLLHSAHQKIKSLTNGREVRETALQGLADPVNLNWQPKHEMDAGGNHHVRELPGVMR